MTNEQKIKKLRDEKDKLIKEVDELVKLKKKLYSKMDITKPMEAKEKQLNKDIAAIFSKTNNLVTEIRELSKKK